MTTKLAEILMINIFVTYVNFVKDVLFNFYIFDSFGTLEYMVMFAFRSTKFGNTLYRSDTKLSFYAYQIRL